MNLTHDKVFYWCVDLLKFYAAKWDMTYEELNVWVFCIIEPAIFLLEIMWIFYLLIRNFRLKRIIQRQKRSITGLQ